MQLKVPKMKIRPYFIPKGSKPFLSTLWYECLCVALQQVEPVASPVASGRQLKGDVQAGQQGELAVLQQQFQQLCLDVDHLTASLKQTSVTDTQVPYTPLAERNGLLI